MVQTTRRQFVGVVLSSAVLVIGFVRTCNKHMAPMTFNIGIHQDGTMAAESVEQLHRLNVALG